jgi:transcription-repair coupling factor (superfamily II helicase)
LKVKDFVRLFKENAALESLIDLLRNSQERQIQLQGLKGSFDALVAAAVAQLLHRPQLFVLHDREEAAYFQNDLQNLFPDREVLFFPTSYKRPYQFEETENANILMRSEVLNRFNRKGQSAELVVTYPEALSEKVVNRRTLLKNTVTLQVGQSMYLEDLQRSLADFDFECNDFVYEAGQYAIRGGIVDLYSYSHDRPYRIEFFGDSVDSIRIFDPETQLSSEHVREISIIPNVQTRLFDEQRQSFLEFIPGNTLLWIKDHQLLLDTLDRYYEKVTENFRAILEACNFTQVILNPSDLFVDAAVFRQHAAGFVRLEFGNRFSETAARVLRFDTEAQPSFSKNFNLIAENLDQWQGRGYRICIVSDSFSQLDRLRSIFEQIDPGLRYDEVHFALRQGFVDRDQRIVCYTDHQLFERFHRYKAREKYAKSKALTLKELQMLKPGDYVTHIDHGIGRFAGLDKVEVNGRAQEALRLVYRDDDLLYVSVHALHKISRYSGKEGVPPAMSKLGSPEWENKKNRVRKKVKDIAKELIGLYAKRKSAPGFAFGADDYLQAELESSFLYEDTPDQARATTDVKEDMQKPHPMDRLVCGDVGFGKTEVAIRAAFKAVSNGKQVAVLVPTTILAMQHYRTFSERLENLPVRVEYINRFKSTANIRNILTDLKAGKVDILIGTHRLVNRDVQFHDLGLLVIDEEQKFGVGVKEKLKHLRINVDVLTLTATPIPRTLHFSLMGARDLSVISTPPPNRQPVTTEIHPFREEIIRDAISRELQRGGQVFFVHNRISDIEHLGNQILRLVPDARIGIAHGQMEGHRLEKVMLRFIGGEYDVLVSTNIIESGLDIPNANTIIINQAHSFGLSDLHQMRGRVGRSNKKAYCYLLAPAGIGLASEARKRLKALEEFSHLGDGFKVAMRDLDIRGAGNLLGAEQSGFINDLGYDAYHKILDETVRELKEEEFRELFMHELVPDAGQLVRECTVETDFEVLIPEKYVGNISERLQLYNQLDNLATEEELQQYIEAMTDRFGPVPHPVQDLIEIVRLRWEAARLGFEKLILKNKMLKGYFITSERRDFFNSEEFGNVLKFVKKYPSRCRLRELNNRLILSVESIQSAAAAKLVFQEIQKINTLQMQ